jgi:hypothetical protein
MIKLDPSQAVLHESLNGGRTRKHGTAAAAQRPPTTLIVRPGRIHVARSGKGRQRK